MKVTKTDVEEEGTLKAVLEASKAVTLSPGSAIENAYDRLIEDFEDEEDDKEVGELVEVVAMSEGHLCTTLGVTPFQRVEAEACRLLVRGVGVLLVKYIDAEPFIFVQKRSSKKKTYPGRRDMLVRVFKRWGEPTEVGASRELAEELGVESDSVQFMYEHVLVSDKVRSVVSCYACICDAQTEVSFKDGEVEGGSWEPFTTVVEDVQVSPDHWVPGGMACFQALLGNTVALSGLKL